MGNSASNVPIDTDWHSHVRISIDDLRLLSSRHFFNRLKLKTGLDCVCRNQAQKRARDRKDSTSNLDVQIDVGKMEFTFKARKYVVSLLEAVLS